MHNRHSLIPSNETVSRRNFMTATASITTAALTPRCTHGADPAAIPQDALPTVSPSQSHHPLLTKAEDFRDVSRGNPKPYTLQGQDLIDARLTTASWRLEITADPSVDDVVTQPAAVARPLTFADGTALTYDALLELGKTHGVKYIKAMQCLNIPTPLGQGLWEGVPLRHVLQLCGAMQNVRRLVYWGFHNDDPEQMFRSSLSFTQAMETAPGELPPFLAYRLNGQPIPLVRGGPVRMIVPWAHGFKSIKWLRNIVLTNDFRANDTYALKNNDPESHLKTAAYVDPIPKRVTVGKPLIVSGLAISGLSGLERVEAWLQRVQPDDPPILDDPTTWNRAKWAPCQLDAPPRDWSGILPADVSTKQLLGFDDVTGQPHSWPLRYGMLGWSIKFTNLVAGSYELRVRAVDLNGFAQPEPRPVLKSGKNAIEVQRFEVG